LHNQAQNAVIGRFWTDGGTYSNGLFDEVYVFDKELTASEAAILHHSSFDTLFTYSTPTSDAVPLYKKVSTDSIGGEQLNSLTGWTDNSINSASVTQVVYEGFETFFVDTGSTGTTDDARITKDIGTIGDNDVICTFRFYPFSLDSGGGDGNFRFIVDNGTTVRQYQFANNGVWVYTSGAWNEVGTNINFVCPGASPTGCWQTWTIDLDETANTFDAYELEATGGQLLFDNHAQTGQAGTTDGNISFYGDCNGTRTRAYVDYFKCGSGFYNE
jgi:hypothetical protein